MGYERLKIQKMNGYIPGKQPEDRDVVKLNTNENPYPPCNAVIEALHQIEPEILRRYPSPLANDFRNLAAQLYSLNPDNVMAVNGGDELLRLAITTFVEPNGAIGIIDPSYSLYTVLADIHGCRVVFMDAQPDWSLPPNLSVHMNRENVQLTFVVNPHTPSGKLTSAEQIKNLASQLDGVLVVDETYVDFIDEEEDYQAVKLVEELDNLLILRTLSKGYSLAGLRFGYGIGSTSLISPMLHKTRDTYNVDAIAQRLAVVALEQRDKARRTWDTIRIERVKLRDALVELGLQVPESQANFLLAKVDPSMMSADHLQQYLEDQKIYVRYFNHPRLKDQLRISIGTIEQNARLLDALRQILSSRAPIA